MSRGAGLVIPATEWSAGHVRTALPGMPASAGVPSGAHQVRACLSRRNTFVRTIRIPNVPAKEADRILKLQAPQAFPVPAQELVYGFRLTGDVSSEGRLAVVIATRADVVRSLHESLRTMGAKPVEVIPAALGSSLLAREMGLQDVAVVETGPEGWSIDIVAGGEIRYSRVIPVETDVAAVESEVCRTFGMAGLPCGAILAAGGARLEFAGHRTEKSTLEMLCGSNAGVLGIQLELPEVVAAREKRLVGNRARLATLLWVSAATLALLVVSHRVEQAEEVRKYQNQWDSGSSKIKSARDASQLKVNAISKLTDVLDRAFKPAQKASDVVTAISAAAPSGVWLTGMTFERGKPTLVRGTATNSNAVAAFLDALSQHERFRDVKLVFSNDATIEDTKVSQFSISLHTIGNLPLADPKSKTRSTSR